MSAEKVLLVDDEMDFTRTLAERLETRGMRVETAGSGEEAIEKARQGSFDAILLDLAMPGLDGIETLKALREMKPDLQIILLTGQATVRQSVEAMKYGAVDLLEKPASIQELLEKIEEASAKKALLLEKHTEDQLADIMRKKGW